MFEICCHTEIIYSHPSRKTFIRIDHRVKKYETALKRATKVWYEVIVPAAEKRELSVVLPTLVFGGYILLDEWHEKRFAERPPLTQIGSDEKVKLLMDQLEEDLIGGSY